MKEFAIRENHLFQKAYIKGRRYVTPRVCLYVLRDYKAEKLKKENPRKEYLNRVGFTATVKLGGAVTRNRCKRIMREAYREILRQRPIKKGNLIVITARERAVTAGKDEVMRDLAYAMDKLELFA